MAMKNPERPGRNDHGQTLPLMSGLLSLAVVALAVVGLSVRDAIDDARLATAADAAALAGAAQDAPAATRFAELNGAEVDAYRRIVEPDGRQIVVVDVRQQGARQEMDSSDIVRATARTASGRSAAEELPGPAESEVGLDAGTVGALKAASDRFGELVVVDVGNRPRRDGLGVQTVVVPLWTAELLEMSEWACGPLASDVSLRECEPLPQ